MARFRVERGLIKEPAVKVGTREDGVAEITLQAEGVAVTMICDDPNDADIVGIGIISANAIGKAMRREPTILDANGNDAGKPLVSNIGG